MRLFWDAAALLLETIVGTDKSFPHGFSETSQILTASARVRHRPTITMASSIAVLSLASGATGYFAVSGLIPSRDSRLIMASETDQMMTDVGLDTLTDAMDAAESAAGGPPPPSAFDVKSLPGITGPLGFFDPVGFSEGATEGKIRFYREVELKHGRVAMLAALGFPLAEQFHPLFGGKIDVPSYIAFQETPLQTFWPAVMITISVFEVFSVFSFNSPFGGETWSIRSDHEPGNLGFDPRERLRCEPTEHGFAHHSLAHNLTHPLSTLSLAADSRAQADQQRRARRHANQGAEQRPAGDDRRRRHDRSRARDRPEAFLKKITHARTKHAKPNQRTQGGRKAGRRASERASGRARSKQLVICSKRAQRTRSLTNRGSETCCLVFVVTRQSSSRSFDRPQSYISLLGSASSNEFQKWD